MSDVSSDDYKSAMATIMQADKDTMTTVQGIVTTLKTAIDTARDSLTSIRDGIPAVAGPASVTLTNLNNWLSQIQSFDFQIVGMANTVSGVVAQYNPPATNTSTSPTP